MPAVGSLNAPTKYVVAPLAKKMRHIPLAGNALRSANRIVNAIRLAPSVCGGSAIKISVMSWAGVPGRVGTLPVPVSPLGSVIAETPGNAHGPVCVGVGVGVGVGPGVPSNAANRRRPLACRIIAALLDRPL